MAKQTFSVGQVLTAAQMTSLQATAMGGGAASSKSANYVVVAADAGTTISMTSTSATTITVNTGLFSAGDTVFIQNLGSATCTITAGTATVDTAGSLILPQYDAGILYFVSASSAIFYDYIQTGATSPLTTKGDLYTFGTSDTRLGVGANGTTLVADSSEATGLKWATPAGGGKILQVINATTTTEVSANSSTYVDTTLTATITPTSATSKILVFVDQNSLFKDNDNDQSHLRIRLLRGASVISTLESRAMYTSTAVRGTFQTGTNYLDTPATTSATTYKTQFQQAGTGTVYCQYSSIAASTMTLMEVGA